MSTKEYIQNEVKKVETTISQLSAHAQNLAADMNRIQVELNQANQNIIANKGALEAFRVTLEQIEREESLPMPAK